jgi:uncharacterized protein with HEPN domain
MSDPQPDSLFLNHILDATQQIELYLSGVSREAFDSTRLLQDGVVRQLEIIGVASKRVSPELKDRTPQIPWARIAGMRNRLTHDYLGVDLDILWETARSSVPQLKQAVQDLVRD